VPRRRKDGLRGFFWPRHAYSSEDEMNAVRDILRAEVKAQISNR
jgi:histidine triad (HIT) family protein